MTLLGASNRTPNEKDYVAALVRICEISDVNPYDMKGISLEAGPEGMNYFTFKIRYLTGPSFIDQTSRLPQRQIVTKSATLPAAAFAAYLGGKSQFPVPNVRPIKPPRH
jgi:hypothetical protein